MMLSIYMIVQAVLTFDAAEMAIANLTLALCQKSLLDTLNALYKRIQMTVVLHHCKYGQHPQWDRS